MGRGWWRPYLSVLQFVLSLAALGWLITRGAAGMHYSWQWYRVPQFVVRYVDGDLVWGPLVRGLLVTLDITLWSLVLTLVLGLATALLRLSRSVVGRGLARLYLEVIRNTPLLVQLYVFYFALAPLFDIDRYLTGIVSLAIFEGAYASEIFRAGILAVAKGQSEAAQSLGLSTAMTYRFVVFPQAARLILPPMTGQAISLIKASAMVSVIAIFDLTTEGRNIVADTFMTFEIWLTVAAIYLVVTVSLSLVVTQLERRLQPAR
jgi:polar amino acid transport system permease protein